MKRYAAMYHCVNGDRSDVIALYCVWLLEVSDRYTMKK